MPMLARAGFWLLLPVAAVQGLWLRRTAARLPGATGHRRGIAGQGRPGNGSDLWLMAIGDSIIDGVGVERIEESFAVQFAAALADRSGRRVRWHLDGLSGRAIKDLLAALDRIDDPPRADVVLVSIGVNDVTGLSSLDAWRRNFGLLLERLRALWPAARLLFAGLPAMERFPLPPQPLKYCLGIRAAALDAEAARQIGNHPDAVHVPTRIDPRIHAFCDDGFHPSAESCRLWAMELAAIESGRESP